VGFASAGIVAQDAEFEVASIKLNTDSGLPPLNVVSKMVMRRAASVARNGRYSKQGNGATTLSALIQAAHRVRDFQILGAPSWVTSERYDVDARAPGATTFDEMRPMLQSLLANRFQLTFRRETRELPVYELVAARNGVKIAPMKPGTCIPPEQAKPFGPLDICGSVRRQITGLAPERKDVVEGVGVLMTTLLEYLIDETGRIVLDKTGFTEVFNFRLEFASTVDTGLANVDTPASGLSIFTALEEQLGLRLRSTTGPVDVLVIDRVERPSPN
jgi:uncharacterized protein (TIGR03435 family)